MPAVDDYAERYRAAVQQRIPDELVLSVGLFTRAHRITPDGMRHAWIVDDVALGAGTAHLFAVHFRPAGMDIETVALIATWPSAEVVAHIDESALVRSLRIETPDAATIELCSNRQIGGFDRLNDRLYRDLGVDVLI